MKKTQKRALAVGAGVAALAAAAAGVYMLTGKNAKNRKKVARWAKDVQSDIVKGLKKAQRNSQSAYNQIVDEVIADYKAAKKASVPELAALARELKGHWNIISSELEHATQTVKKIKPKARASRARKVKVRR